MECKNIKISSEFPGGNIKLIGIKDNVVEVEQEIRDTTEWWFYWNFYAENASEGEVIFKFCNGEVVGPWGPAVSKDGVTYDWLGKDKLIDRTSFKYCFNGSGERVYFSFSLPYQLSHFEGFYNRYKENKLLTRKILTISEQGREVPLLCLGNPDAGKDIVFTCRHHACESTAAYELEGLISYLLDKGNSLLLEDYAIHIVPFVDIDGVEKGDQGKSRAPHDHNRDYIEKPVYRTTAAIMDYVKGLNPVVGIDFHSPCAWGGPNDHAFLVKQESPVKEEIEKFGGILKGITMNDKSLEKIVYTSKHDIDMGVDWNQPGSATYSSFMAKQGARLAMTIEFPYFGVEGMVYTQQNSRGFGANVARALETYLEK